MADTSPSQAENPRGGPRTPAGKASSRGNALRHGLAARTLPPDLFTGELIDRCDERLRAEWRPATHTQELLVREVARHQAALERIEQQELAVLRCGARQPLELGLPHGAAQERIDEMLAASGTSEGIKRISRYRRQHERALLRNLEALQEARRSPRWPPAPSPPAPPPASPPPGEPRHAFATEQQCEAYLAERLVALQGGGRGCPRCGGQPGTWLPSRRVWQCGTCKRQLTPRYGTLMAASRLPLLAWFRAIERLVRQPGASLADLAATTQLGREATLRSVARRIRQALGNPDGLPLLAGLDVLFAASGQPARPGGPPAEPTVAEISFLPNELVPAPADAEEDSPCNR